LAFLNLNSVGEHGLDIRSNNSLEKLREVGEERLKHWQFFQLIEGIEVKSHM